MWSRCQEADDCSYEVIGFSVGSALRCSPEDYGEHWVPESLRDEYENWVTSEVPFIVSGPSWCEFMKIDPQSNLRKRVVCQIENVSTLIAARSARIQQLLD